MTSPNPFKGSTAKRVRKRNTRTVGRVILVYDAVEGELNIYYSEIPIIGAVGVWTSADILVFKQAQGLGTSELIGNCATQVQARKSYYNGW